VAGIAVGPGPAAALVPVAHWSLALVAGNDINVTLPSLEQHQSDVDAVKSGVPVASRAPSRS